MTQETKFGLLIGGTFIFCFALILSNSKDHDIIDAEVSSLLSSTTPAVAAGLAIDSSGTLLPDELFQTRSLPPAPQAAMLPGVDTPDRTSPPPGQTVIVTTDPVFGAPQRQSPTSPTPPDLSTVTDAIINRPLKPADEPAPADTVLVDAPDPRRPQAAGFRQPAAPRKSVVYVTVRNDNLTKIARKFYGQAGPANIRRIYEANRSALESPNAIKVGQKLDIPIEGDPPRRTASSGDVTDTVLASARRASSYRWYQVQKNDGYYKIARDQLGDAGRWRELYELNRNLFPDPDDIRPGVKIRIPR